MDYDAADFHARTDGTVTVLRTGLNAVNATTEWYSNAIGARRR